MVLLKDAKSQVRRDIDTAGICVFIATEHLDERGFTSAICTDKTVALARIKLHRDVLEEDLGAKAFGDVIEKNHGSFLA